jgi:hypothetical protein
MYLAGFLSAAGRRTFLTMGLAAALCTSPSALQAQGAAGAAPPPAQADAFSFASADSGMIIWPVPEAKVADFEAVWAEILAKLATSDKPNLKELGASIKILKPNVPGAGQPISYFILADPASKSTSYSPVYLLYESGLFPREEGDKLFKRLPTDGISALPLKKVQTAP